MCFVLQNWPWLEGHLIKGVIKDYLIVCHTAIAYLQHVQVIPASRLPSVHVWSDFIEDIQNRAVTARRDAKWTRSVCARAQVIWS